MKKITAEIYYEAGRYKIKDHLHDAKRLSEFCEDNADKSGEITLSVGEPSKSVQQMRFYRGPLTRAFVDATGESNVQYLHHHLKSMYLTRHDDAGREWIPSLADLDVHEMSAFIERCLQELASCGGSLYSDEFALLEKVRVKASG